MSATSTTDNVGTAEQVVDVQTTMDLFQGKEWPVPTGRVVRHALVGANQLACGLDGAEMTHPERPWHQGGIPPKLRCEDCLRLFPIATDTGPAFELRLRNGRPEEESAAAALLDALAPFDVRRWIYTDLVVIDGDLRGGMSHPLRLGPHLLLLRPHSALTTFLHEQLHWFVGHHANLAAVIDEARKRWPDPPPPPAGCADAYSTWTHLSVCALEYQSLCELVGTHAAETELRLHNAYSWVYSEILDAPSWFEEYLCRHDLILPSEPPVPRQYLGDDSWNP